MENYAVLFTEVELTSKKGVKYFSGKTEGSDGFDLLGFPRVSKAGKKYISIVKVEPREEEVKLDKQDEGGEQGGEDLIDDLPF